MLIDKTAFIAGVLDSGYTATLFCRPRCFGKTLNMTIMKAYFEAPPAGLADPGLFEGTDIWEMGGGAYREHFAAYPRHLPEYAYGQGRYLGADVRRSQGYARRWVFPPLIPV